MSWMHRATVVLIAVGALALAACSGPVAPVPPTPIDSPDSTPAPVPTWSFPEVPVDVADFPAPPAEWWDPGYIVSDANFFDANSMTVEEIDSLIYRELPYCATWHARSQMPNDSGLPYTCLKDRLWDIPYIDQPGDDGTQYCAPIAPATRVSTGVVIATVASACGISPKTLLVTLEKEMSLLTDPWPWEVQFRSALGFACPDSAPCDPDFYGFVGQIYSAARQFQVYVQRPELFNFQAGTDNDVMFGTECHAGSIFIRNGPTAALYNYTPYQPNQFIVAGGGGESVCDAYGNYNFWKIWWNWFGDPQADDPATARTMPEAG